jgi:hypothetical protein
MGEFDPEALLATLERHGVDYVLIGGLAATLHGAAYVTYDVDITPDASAANLARLSDALVELKARVRVEGEPGGLIFDHDAASLARATTWNLVTRFGELDVTLRPAGTAGYEDLRRDAVRLQLDDLSTQVASLADVIRSKEAAGRPKDLQALPLLRVLLERIEGSSD